MSSASLRSLLLAASRFGIRRHRFSPAASTLLHFERLCNFSSETVTNESNSGEIQPPLLPTFQYAKSQALFAKIVANCSQQDVTLLAHELNRLLGRTFRPNEFYHRGFFGGSKQATAAHDNGAAATTTTTSAAAAAAKTQFDVKLVAFDDKAKIKIIKEVRAVAGLGLKEAKELVESAPKVITSNMSKEAAEQLQQKLQELGATIELV